MKKPSSSMTMARATTCVPQAFPPHHEGPVSTVLHVMPFNPRLRAGIEAETASPDPIPRATSFHPTHLSREVAAASHTATPAE